MENEITPVTDTTVANAPSMLSLVAVTAVITMTVVSVKTFMDMGIKALERRAQKRLAQQLQKTKK